MLVLGEMDDRADFVNNRLSVMAKEISAEALKNADVISSPDGKCELSTEQQEQIYRGRHYGKSTIVCAQSY